MIPSTIKPSRRLRFQIQDILSLVVGYGMAAVLFRAFWPSSGLPVGLGLPALGLYLWLGLAMSGPIVLLQHGPRPHPMENPVPAAGSASSPSRTWAEWTWLLIGIYWTILGFFAIPSRLHEFRFPDAILYGLVPILMAIVLRRFGPKVSVRLASTTIWTHLAAVCLLSTWPIAWACLIILGKRLP